MKHVILTSIFILFKPILTFKKCICSHFQNDHSLNERYHGFKTFNGKQLLLTNNLYLCTTCFIPIIRIKANHKHRNIERKNHPDLFHFEHPNPFISSKTAIKDHNGKYHLTNTSIHEYFNNLDNQHQTWLQEIHPLPSSFNQNEKEETEEEIPFSLTPETAIFQSFYPPSSSSTRSSSSQQHNQTNERTMNIIEETLSNPPQSFLETFSSSSSSPS